MTSQSPNKFELEAETLGALCNPALALARRANAVQKLAGYSWLSPDHRVIYEALRRARERDSTALHEYLKAEVTRLGFPDIDWDAYLKSPNPPTTDIDLFVGALLARASDAPELN